MALSNQRLAKKHRDQLEIIRTNVEESYQYFKDNYDSFDKLRRFVFKTNLDEDARSKLEEIGKPPLEFNICEAYISRLRGEFFKQEPSFKVSGSDESTIIDSKDIQFYEGHLRSILDDTKESGLEFNVYTDQLSGGFSAIKVWTEYANEVTFNQKIRIGKVFDPTMVGFDPMAQLPHKGDGEYCYELFPMTLEEFEETYPNIDATEINFSRNPVTANINWQYANSKKKIILICDYYKKVKKKFKVLFLSNKQTMTEDEYEQLLLKMSKESIEQPPVVIKERQTTTTYVCRYRFTQNYMLEYKETNFKYLPIVFVDGNSVMLKNSVGSGASQCTRSYVEHAQDAQKLKNFAGQTIAAEIENMRMSQYMIPEEGVSANYIDDWTQPQKRSTLVYRAYVDNDPSKPIPAPTAIMRVPLPPEIPNTFLGMDSTIQNILGSYDAALGINKNQLSGVAIIEGATQSNATAMPFIANYLIALNQVAIIILDLIPKYYITPRSVPVVMLNGKKGYQRINDGSAASIDVANSKHQLTIKVEAGVNFEIQKSRSLETMVNLARAFPSMEQLINTQGLPILIDNLDIRGSDQLKQLAEQQMSKMQQQQANGPPPNPVVQLKQQQMQLDAQENQRRAQIDTQKLQLEAVKAQNDKLDSILTYLAAEQHNRVLLSKAVGEQVDKTAKSALEANDQIHQHSLDNENHLNDTIQMTHKIVTQPQSI